MSDPVSLSLRAALDLRWRRHEVLAHNVANADTPGYKPKDLEFQAVLQDAMTAEPTPSPAIAMAGTRPAPLAEQEVVERADTLDTLDENWVDTDREMARIADNSVQYNAAMEVLRRRYGMVRGVITDLARI